MRHLQGKEKVQRNIAIRKEREELRLAGWNSKEICHHLTEKYGIGEDYVRIICKGLPSMRTKREEIPVSVQLPDLDTSSTIERLTGAVMAMRGEICALRRELATVRSYAIISAKKLLTVEEAAFVAGCGKTYMWRCVYGGRIPTKKFMSARGGTERILIDLNDLNDWIEGKCAINKPLSDGAGYDAQMDALARAETSAEKAIAGTDDFLKQIDAWLAGIDESKL